MSITALVSRMQSGDPAALNELFEYSYSHLLTIASCLMRNERSAHTLGPNGLIHELFLGPLRRMDTPVGNRTHFYALAAISMRRVLIDHSRRRGATKRRLELPRSHRTAQLPVDDALIDLTRGIDELRKLDPNIAFVVELKHIVGLTLEEIAEETGRPYRTVRADWDFARAWLARRLAGR